MRKNTPALPAFSVGKWWKYVHNRGYPVSGTVCSLCTFCIQLRRRLAVTHYNAKFSPLFCAACTIGFPPAVGMPDKMGIVSYPRYTQP